MGNHDSYSDDSLFVPSRCGKMAPGPLSPSAVHAQSLNIRDRAAMSSGSVFRAPQLAAEELSSGAFHVGRGNPGFHPRDVS